MKKFIFLTAFLLIPVVASISSPIACQGETDSVIVTPPAIIAVINPSKSASNDEFKVVLDDFSFHLSFAQQKLKSHGVNFYIVEQKRVVFKFADITGEIDLPKEDALVGYVFISGEGKILKRYHVLSDIEIVELANKHFNLSPQY